MTTPEKLYQLIETLPEQQVKEILHFAEALNQTTLNTPPTKAIPPGTLTGLRGIAKPSGSVPSDSELQTEYTDYLIQKYL